MRLSDAIKTLGRPVAYYPELARFFGSVDAAILFAQLFYWSDKAAHEYQYQTAAKIEAETGLTAREQLKAKRLLSDAGILEYKHARLLHETHFRLLLEAFDAAWEAWQAEGKPDRLRLARQRKTPAKRRDGTFRKRHRRSPQRGVPEAHNVAVGNTA